MIEPPSPLHSTPFGRPLTAQPTGRSGGQQEEQVEAAARCPVDARWRNTVLLLQGLPCCDAVVGVWRGGIDVDREHASPAAHGHSDQRVRVLAEVATHHHGIDRRAVHPMRVERLLLPDRAYGEHWNACLRERQRSVEGRSSAQGGGNRAFPNRAGSDATGNTGPAFQSVLAALRAAALSSRVMGCGTFAAATLGSGRFDSRGCFIERLLEFRQGAPPLLCGLVTDYGSPSSLSRLQPTRLDLRIGLGAPDTVSFAENAYAHSPLPCTALAFALGELFGVECTGCLAMNRGTPRNRRIRERLAKELAKERAAIVATKKLAQRIHRNENFVVVISST